MIPQSPSDLSGKPVTCIVDSSLMERALAEARRLDGLAPISDTDLPAIRRRATVVMIILAAAVDQAPASFRGSLSGQIVRSLR